MKTNYFLSALALTALLFTASCETDDTADVVINDNSVDNSDNSVTNNNGGGDGENPNPQGNQDLDGGTFTEDLTLAALEGGACYILSDALIMAEGTTLTIPAGTCIRAEGGAGVYIAISQGAKIMADGTADAPIVMTSNQNAQNPGDWGGLILLGRAPINSVAGGDATSSSEIGNLPYGGSVSNDDSGSLTYVRVEYSGGAADGATENNGFSFYGVGSGTQISYIQAFEGADDGVEFFGGTVNASFVSVVGCQDDSIDWTEGYTGTLTDVYVKHGPSHDKGFECDGYNTDIGNNSSTGFFSAPTVSNVTIDGIGGEAIRLRAGTQGIFTNVLLNGFEEGFDLDGDMGENPTGQGVLDGELSATDVTADDDTVDSIDFVKNDTGFTFEDDAFLTGIGNGTGTDFATWGAGWARN